MQSFLDVCNADHFENRQSIYLIYLHVITTKTIFDVTMSEIFSIWASELSVPTNR